MFPVIRLMLGGLFIVSGVEKIFGGPANFLYVIQAYDILPDTLAPFVAHCFPWIELAIGMCVLCGLWLEWALKGLALMSLLLMGMVGQAIIRQLPIDSCGCFGALIHIPLRGVIFLDATVLILTAWCYRNLSSTARFGIDSLYETRTS